MSKMQYNPCILVSVMVAPNTRRQHRQYSEFTTETPQAFLGNNRSNQSYKPPPYHNSTKGDLSRKSRPFCDYCKRTGHIRDKCFKLNDYPPKSGTLPQGNRRGKQVAAVVTHDDTDTDESLAPVSDRHIFTQEQYS